MPAGWCVVWCVYRHKVPIRNGRVHSPNVASHVGRLCFLRRGHVHPRVKTLWCKPGFVPTVTVLRPILPRQHGAPLSLPRKLAYICTVRVSTIAKIFDPVYLSDEYSSFTDPFSVLVYIYLQGTDVLHPHGHLSHAKKQTCSEYIPNIILWRLDAARCFSRSRTAQYGWR
ncbi:hypothetical protein EDD85DRAFT_499709 [Armillaria nabsnona]|nr:hypothetical protein EDD85DRAFT_499709 [Armillaria nabsnona]